MDPCREPGTVGDPALSPARAEDGFPCQVCREEEGGGSWLAFLNLWGGAVVIVVSRRPDGGW